MASGLPRPDEDKHVVAHRASDDACLINSCRLETTMRLFTYVIVSDSGFAPNPYWGYCTLATCKPVIRRVAKADD